MSLPQGKYRTAHDKAEFRLMLPNINLLYVLAHGIPTRASGQRRLSLSIDTQAQCC